MTLQEEITRRRTFAVIAHPDAGKTTLTEKLLLFGGAIHVAGAVKSNKIKKGATSDFMEIERQRGISVATAVMGFEYKGAKINILDTPGHEDFAEDTFRTLTAVDSVIIVIDGAKGVESQTRKLMEVCRMRSTPVIVFINKLDRPSKEPFDLLDEVEKELNIRVRPLAFPISNGPTFKGVYNLYEKNLSLFTSDEKLLARRLDAAFDHEDVGAVAAGIHAVFDHTILVEVQRIEPSVLMHPSHMLAAAAFGRHDHMRNVALGGRQLDLIVAGRMVLRVGQHPYLQKLDRLGLAGVHLAVRDARAGRHHLNLSRTQDFHVAHAVAVPERAFQRDRHDLHVVVRMGSETLARSHGVVVQHPEGAEMHPAGIVIVCKTERMVSLQPTVVGITARLGAVNRLVHNGIF